MLKSNLKSNVKVIYFWPSPSCSTDKYNVTKNLECKKCYISQNQQKLSISFGMVWIKPGILLIGFTHASLLPSSIRKALDHVNFDLKNKILSFSSNKSLYGDKFVKGYKWLPFVTALLTYTFFWLLTEFYNLGEYDRLMRYIDLGFASLALLAFVPHNLSPYSLKSLGTSLQRIIHNLLSVVVFFSLPALIVTFQVAILSEIKFLGITGMALIGLTVLSVAISMLKNGINGATELLFINGIRFWTIFVTIVTLLS